MSNNLIQLIQASDYLQPTDKDFLIASLPHLEPLDQLKLKQNLNARQAPVLLKQLEFIRTKYQQAQQAQSEPDPLSKLVEKIVPKKPKAPLSFSIFSKPNVLGAQPPSAVTSNLQAPAKISELNDPSQLQFFTPDMLDEFNSENPEQTLLSVMNQLSNLFNRIEAIAQRRNYLLTFMQSKLFTAYISTGLTAMKHEELKPRKISLNLLYQIDQRYLNAKQFRTTALLVNHLRTLCAL